MMPCNQQSVSAYFPYIFTELSQKIKTMEENERMKKILVNEIYSYLTNEYFLFHIFMLHKPHTLSSKRHTDTERPGILTKML